MLARKGSDRNPHSLLVGMQNGAATLEDSLSVPYTTKQPLAIQSTNHASWHLPKGTENLYPHENLYVVVYSSFIRKFPNLEATKMSFSR